MSECDLRVWVHYMNAVLRSEWFIHGLHDTRVCFSALMSPAVVCRVMTSSSTDQWFDCSKLQLTAVPRLHRERARNKSLRNAQSIVMTIDWLLFNIKSIVLPTCHRCCCRCVYVCACRCATKPGLMLKASAQYLLKRCVLYREKSNIF